MDGARDGSSLNARQLHSRSARGQRELIRAQVHLDRLDPEHVLDPTCFVVTGPPVVTADLRAVAGTHRSILLSEAARRRQGSFAAYTGLLRDRASWFGFSATDIGDAPPVVLVRVLSDGCWREEEALRALNRLSDRSLTKPKDLLSQAETLAAYYRHATAAQDVLLSFFAEVSRTQATTGRRPYDRASLDFFLRGAWGRRFLEELARAHVIDDHDLALFEHPRTGFVSSLGRPVLMQMLAACALGDALALDDIDEGVAAVLAPSLPWLVAEPAGTGRPWSELKQVFREALDLLRGFAGSRQYRRRRAEALSQLHLLDDLFAGAVLAARERFATASEPARSLALYLITRDGWWLRGRVQAWGGPISIVHDTGDPRPHDEASLFGSVEPVPSPVVQQSFEEEFSAVFGLTTFRGADLGARERDTRLRDEIRRLGMGPPSQVARARKAALHRLVPDEVWEVAVPLLADLPRAWKSPASGRRRAGRMDLRAVLAIIVHLRGNGVPWRRFRTYWNLYPETWSGGRRDTIRHVLRAWQSAPDDGWTRLCRTIGVSPTDRGKSDMHRRDRAVPGVSGGSA